MMFLLPIMVKDHQEHLDAWCFGKCGKIKIGGVDDSAVGPCLVCMQEQCPAPHTDFPEPSGEVSGELATLRRVGTVIDLKGVV